MKGSKNPITKTLAALAIGATMFASQGCAGRAITGALETGRNIANSGRGINAGDVRMNESMTPEARDKFIRSYANDHNVKTITSEADYAKHLQHSFQIPVILLTYSRFDELDIYSVAGFCEDKFAIPLKKGLIADDAKELEGMVGQVLKNGQNIIILDKGKSYGCKRADLDAWVSAYQLAQEKASANK